MTAAPWRRLIPHAGAMSLLAGVTVWSADVIECRATSPLDPANPLRRNGRLSALAGIEYALQAAALHGALRGGSPQPAGFLAALRMTHLATEPIDDPALGTLAVHARREHGDASGLLYAIRVASEHGRALLDGRATIMLTRV